MRDQSVHRVEHNNIVAEIVAEEAENSSYKVRFGYKEGEEAFAFSHSQQWDEDDLLALSAAARKAYNWIMDKSGHTRIT